MKAKIATAAVLILILVIGNGCMVMMLPMTAAMGHGQGGGHGEGEKGGPAMGSGSVAHPGEGGIHSNQGSEDRDQRSAEDKRKGPDRQETQPGSVQNHDEARTENRILD